MTIVTDQQAHCVMFMQKPKKGKDYLLYMFPESSEDSDQSIHFAQRLADLKGAMLTVHAACQDVFGAQTEQIVIQYENKGKDVRPGDNADGVDRHGDNNDNSDEMLVATYRQIHDDLIFIMVLPQWHYHEVNTALMDDLLSLLHFLYPSIDSVIQDTAQHEKLNVIFSHFFITFFKARGILKQFLPVFHPGHSSMQLTFSLQHRINNELSALESTLNEEDHLIHERPRPSFIVGSCLFHAGTLVASHLDPKVTKHIVRYVTYQNLIFRSREQPEVLIMKDVFLDTDISSNAFGLLMNGDAATNMMSWTDGAMSRSQTAKFTLVVLAQGEDILCTLLDVKLEIDGQSNPYYVHQMRACLKRIRNGKIFEQVDHQLSKLAPALADPLPFAISKRSKPTADQKTSNMIITSGSYNVLLHYMSYSVQKGTILMPLHISHVHIKSIEKQFVKHIEHIRHALVAQKEVVGLEDGKNVLEYSIRVIDTKSIPMKSITYWITGTDTISLVTPQGDEFYVCCEESIPQSAIRLAHKIGLQ